MAGDPGLTESDLRQAALTARWLQKRELRALYSSPPRRAQATAAAVSHGAATIDLLRTVLGDDVLPPHLLGEGIPACAITTLEDLDSVAIASTAHLR